MKFKQESLAERVLIEPEVETMSKGGIAIARDARSQAINTDRGIVKMIGDQAWYDLPKKPNIKVGDKVMYSHYGAKTFKIGDKFLIICNDKDILIAYEEDGEQAEINYG